jgi:acylphosphatase
VTGRIAARRFFISGRVQGVWFRASTAREALRLGINGWARNLNDGRVEVLATGAPAALDELAAWLRRGPPMAKVHAVEALTIEPAAVDLVDGFSTR